MYFCRPIDKTIGCLAPVKSAHSCLVLKKQLTLESSVLLGIQHPVFVTGHYLV